jgi:hypothetical protein
MWRDLSAGNLLDRHNVLIVASFFLSTRIEQGRGEMRRTKVAGLGALAALVLGFVTAPRADAAFIATMDQVGSDVVITGSGSFDTAGLTSIPAAPSSPTAFVFPSKNILFLGGGGTQNAFSGLTPDDPTFGGGELAYASSTSGAQVGIAFAAGLAPNSLYLPGGYVSGISVSDLTTFSNATFASLDVTPGTYVWTWGRGDDADSFTLQIGPAATGVPEPASLALLSAGVLSLGLIRRKRTQ